jgi:mRNA interferase HigB
MRVIARKTLQDFWVAHAGAEQPLRAWFHEVRNADWKSFQAIRQRYRSADALPGNRVVFNLKGNTYRLVVTIHYNTRIVFVRFIGTHAEYDRIDATTI